MTMPSASVSVGATDVSDDARSLIRLTFTNSSPRFRVPDRVVMAPVDRFRKFFPGVARSVLQTRPTSAPVRTPPLKPVIAVKSIGAEVVIVTLKGPRKTPLDV